MTKLNTGRSIHPAYLLSLTAAIVAAVLAPAGGTDEEPARALDHVELRMALASTPAPEGVELDVLRWAEKRSHADSGDRIALQKRAAVRMRRFRASGSMDELRDAEAVASRLGGIEGHAAGLLTGIGLATHDVPLALKASAASTMRADEGDPDGQLGRFDALWAAGHYAEARELLGSSEPEGPTPESAARLSRRARLLDGLGDVEAARELMSRAVAQVDAYDEADVVRAWARVELGHFSAHSGDPDAAVDAYLDALDVVPGYPAALEGLAWIAYGVDGAPHVAQTLFQAALDAGAHLDVRLTLAEVLEARGHTSEAQEQRERFLAEAGTDERSVRMYHRPMARLLADEPGRLDEALEHAEADLTLRQDRMAWAVRGLVLARMGRTNEALADAERAIAWGSPEPGVLELAGRIHLAAGDTRTGHRLLREALDGSSELGPVVTQQISTLLD